MEQEFEIIAHDNVNYKMFLVNMIYRTPHIHKDFEIGLVIEGQIMLSGQDHSLYVQKGSFWIMNPFQVHEIKAGPPALLLSLQVSPAFFSSYYPGIEYLEFTSCCIPGDECPELTTAFIRMAVEYMSGKELYEFRCASLLNQLFSSLMTSCPYRFSSEKERLASKAKAKRMRSITDYIDTHYPEKLHLTEIARREQLSLSYLSHFFKDSFGISFQNYLLKIRCEKAHQLLLLTELSLLDICIACGFSDPKYFNSGFKRLYGCTPKSYRKQMIPPQPFPRQKPLPTTQRFLSPAEGLKLLNSLQETGKKRPKPP